MEWHVTEIPVSDFYVPQFGEPVFTHPAIGTKVVCAYPMAVIWQYILGYLVLAYAITQFFRPVTWCKGYKYNKKCALYIFVYDEDH